MNRFDVVVVGAGHAGIEAALAAARLGCRTAVVTLRRDRIGYLPCNCSIGGPAKGHMAREVDAMGGQMGIAADRATTHIRRVGTGRGPAVQTLRAHVCKELYPQLMRAVLESTPNLTVIEDQAITGRVQRGMVVGVDLAGGGLECRSLVLTTGTFLNGVCHMGHRKTSAARFGDLPSLSLSGFLIDHGVRLRRFKTGTTPRIAKSSINFSRVEAVPSEADAGTISFLPGYRPDRPLLPTWQTFTQPATHQVIQENLGHSAMYGGQISGSGPRYCPSIEDKVVRFAEKDSHPVWLEQETWDGESFYVQGVSTSLPEEVQLAFLRTIPGLADVLMLRPGYAVEYDMADPLQLSPHLMSQELDGLFLAGQLNGTSGYEEAAGQGLVAGINAAHYAQEKPPVDFPRDESFIGVMIDDLTTKGVDDPYRMLTGRSEHRLLLRSDNADARLTPKAKELGLASEERIRLWETKREAIERGQAWMENTYVTTVANDRLTERGSAPVAGRASLFDLCRRPELRLEGALAVYAQANPVSNDPEVRTQIELAALYDGYWQRQQRTAEESRRLDTMRIPDHWDYKALTALSAESREKLARVRPATIGQASRVPGVRASDIAVLIGFLRAAQAATTSA